MTILSERYGVSHSAVIGKLFINGKERMLKVWTTASTFDHAGIDIQTDNGEFTTIFDIDDIPNGSYGHSRFSSDIENIQTSKNAIKTMLDFIEKIYA